MNDLRTDLYTSLRGCRPSQLGDVLVHLGLDTNANIPTAPAEIATRAQATLAIVEQRPGGLEALRHALFAMTPDLLPSGERELAGLRARLRAYLDRAYGNKHARKGLAGEADLDDKALAGKSLDGLLVQLSDRTSMRAVVRLLLQALEPDGDDERAELTALFDDLRDDTDDDDDALAIGIWKKWVADDNRLVLARHPWVRERALGDVFVEVRVSGHGRGPAQCLDGRDVLPRGKRPDGPLGRRTLEDVLARGGDEGNFWTLVGHPGSGKTTLLRRVAIAVAEGSSGGERDSGARVPIYVSLAAWAQHGGKLLAHVEREAMACDRMPKQIASLLRQALHDGDALLLLDGLDEVDAKQLDRIARAIAGFATEWPKSQIVVSSRPHGYRKPSAAFGELELLPLTRKQQRQLAHKWFSARGLDLAAADRLCAEIRDDVSRRALAEVPLLMTMMCFERIARLKGELPDDPDAPRAARPRLYHEITRLLLAGKPVAGETKHRKIRNEAVAREVLEELALDLLATDAHEWTRAELERRLIRGPDWNDVKCTFDDAAGFFEDIQEVSGVLFAADSAKSRYRFLHRSLQEYLAACALRRREPPVWLELARGIKDSEGRLAEVFSLLAGMLPADEAFGLLRRLATIDAALGLRALSTCDGLTDEHVVEILKVGRLEADWTGYIPEKDRNVLERGRFFADMVEKMDDPPRAVQLIRRLLPRASVIDQALLYRVLECIEGPEAEDLRARENFFAAAGRPLKDVGATWKELPEQTFRMGTSAEDERGSDGERPAQEVHLSPFAIMTTCVTWGMYRKFAPDHGPRQDHETDDHPVTHVSWFEAYLFSRWLGGQLPTEAQWECACRAGRDTAYCFGDDEAQLAKYAWYEHNADNQTHPVGEKKPNDWDLFDMHGNVWEWCRDGWRREYSEQREVNPEHPSNTDGDRVVRGGSAWFKPRRVRSAYRNWSRVESRGWGLGFRCVRAPRPQH